MYQCYTKFNIIFIYLLQLIRWACVRSISSHQVAGIYFWCNQHPSNWFKFAFILEKPTGTDETLNFSAKEIVSTNNHAVFCCFELLPKPYSTVTTTTKNVTFLSLETIVFNDSISNNFNEVNKKMWRFKHQQFFIDSTS